MVSDIRRNEQSSSSFMLCCCIICKHLYIFLASAWSKKTRQNIKILFDSITFYWWYLARSVVLLYHHQMHSVWVPLTPAELKETRCLHHQDHWSPAAAIPQWDHMHEYIFNILNLGNAQNRPGRTILSLLSTYMHYLISLGIATVIPAPCSLVAPAENIAQAVRKKPPLVKWSQDQAAKINGKCISRKED